MGIKKLILPIYTKMLERSVMGGKKPSHIMVVADEMTDKMTDTMKEFVEWCRFFGVKEVTFCFSKNKIRKFDTLGIKINVVTLSGKKEIVFAVRELAKLVEKGAIAPEDVDEKVLERYLEVKSSPDLIIRAGETIPDFLIWQSIYSELYFADLNWEKFRYVDFLRCLREYQRRERRYGR
ncbi:MAG: di-trans,poly-cis-decaprenylcistransferase [Archaeoglobus sp.]|nr:MAG: di-trans,poly-cis-decaprenylcistransferase [Archaeoglobus sp.]